MKKYIFAKGKDEYEIKDSWFDYTLTESYSSVSDEVKEDYLKNQFDGDVSWFFKDGKDIIGGVLAKSIEPTEIDAEGTRWKCMIYGFAIVEEEFGFLASMFRQYIWRIKGISRNKPPRRFRGKYSHILAVPDNEGQRQLLEHIGFSKQEGSQDIYTIKLR